MSIPERTRFFGAFSHRPRWGLTLRGFAMLTGIFAVVAVTFLFTIHPFLSLNHKIATPNLVVEGWIAPDEIEDAAREFETGGYSRIFITGGPIEGANAEYHSYPEQGYQRLQRQGVPTNVMTMVPAPKAITDRTYTSAVALRKYLSTNQVSELSFNIFTESAHARRSHLLFRKAFGPEAKIGIIACPPEDYRADRWWISSQGLKEIISETSGYVYARLLFWPSKPD